MADTYNIDYGFQILKQSVLMTWGLSQQQYDRMTKQIEELEQDFRRQLENEELRGNLLDRPL